MKKELTLIFFVGACLISSTTMAQTRGHQATLRKIQIDELAKLVAEKNENVEAAKLHAQAQEDRTGKLARSFLPQVSAIAGNEEFKTGSAPSQSQEYWRVEASINLYRGGRDKLENEIRNSNVSLSKNQLTFEYKQELKEAKVAYWNAVALNQQIADIEEALKKNESNLKSSKRRAGAGLTTTADVAQFELHRISLERQLSKLRLEKDVALNQLGVAIGSSEHENIEVQSGFPEVSIKETTLLTQEPSKTNELVTTKIQKNLEKIETLKSDQSSRWWQPKVDVYSAYGLPSLSDEYDRALTKKNEWTVGVRMTLDLGQGFEDRREALARRKEALSFQKRAAHSIREGMARDHELKHDLTVLSGLICSSDRESKLAADFLRLTESEYSRGVKNGPDLLEAVEKYFEFRSSRTNYLKDYFTTKAEIESLLSENQETP